MKKVGSLAGSFALILLTGLGRFDPNGGGSGGAGPGTTLETITFVNDGVSTQNGCVTDPTHCVPTQTFGLVVHDGDICSTDAPQFVSGATTQPFSAGPANTRVYWASGCLRFVAIMLRPTFDLAAGASQNITVKNGGTWPSASARTLAEVYNQQLVLNNPASSVSDAGFSGTLSAWLDDPATDTNNLRTVTWMDGDAGKCWRSEVKMAATKAGTPHASAQVGFYYCGLTNGSGNLAGFRWLGTLRQPSYNFSGAPATYMVFAQPNSGSPTSGVNWQINPGGGGLVTNVPQWPFVAQAFTTSGGATASTTSANHYYNGGGSGNMVPGHFSGASLPSPLAAGSLRYIQAFNTTQFAAGPTGDGNGSYTLGSGSGTFTPDLVVQPFERVSLANKDGKYNFFQGTGAATAEMNLRERIDQTYFQKAKVFPPWDLTLCGSTATPLCVSGGGVISDTTFSYDYVPYGIGTTNRDMTQSGDHPDIGVVTSDAVTDFYNQSFLSEKKIRLTAFAAGNLLTDLKDDTNLNIPSLSFTGGPTYTNLTLAPSAGNIGWVGHGGTDSLNFNFSYPTTTAVTSVGMSTSIDHEPEYAAYAYARTGELQFLDMQIDQAQFAELLNGSWRYPQLVSLSYPNFGIVTAWEPQGVQYRQMAWNLRNLQWAAMFIPFNPTNSSATMFDGSQAGLYINDMADHSANYPVDQFNAGATVYGTANTYVQANGLWSMASLDNTDANCQASVGPPCYQKDGPEWEKAFVAMGMVIAAERGNAKAKTWIQKTIPVWWKHIGDTFGYWHLYHYYEKMGDIINCPYNQHVTNHLNTSDSHYAIDQIESWSSNSSYPSWAAATPAFTIQGQTIHHYTISNGDVLTPWCGSFGNTTFNAPSAMALNTPYYVISLTSPASGGKFDVSTSLGGGRLNITDSSPPVFSLSFISSNPPTTDAPAFSSETIPINRSLAVWARALGIDSVANGFQAVETDANFRIANTSPNICNGSTPCTQGSNGGFYQVASGVSGSTVDARYAVQDHFGP